MNCCRCAFFDPENIKKISNTVPDLGYYTNNSTGTISQNGCIPLEETLVLGENISSVDSETISLETGIYEISFSLVSVPTGTGTVKVSLITNNVESNISSSASAETSKKYPLSGCGIVVASASTIICLKNKGDNGASFSNVNLVIEKK